MKYTLEIEASSMEAARLKLLLQLTGDDPVRVAKDALRQIDPERRALEAAKLLMWTKPFNRSSVLVKAKSNGVSMESYYEGHDDEA